jgi:hypothetical protein
MFGLEKPACDGDSKQASPSATEADHDVGSVAYVDKAAEKSYRKLNTNHPYGYIPITSQARS